MAFKFEEYLSKYDGWSDIVVVKSDNFLTDLQRSNLRKLATYLWDSIPPPKFSMGSWINFTKQWPAELRGWSGIAHDLGVIKIEYYTNPVFGTVACAAGHGPMLGLSAPEIDKHKINKTKFGWNTYIEEVFGVRMYDISFDWLFESSWVSYDNTPQGAAARIEYFLHHNACPTIDLTEYDLW